MTNKTVIILAGGKGTRLAGLYPDLPKPLIPVAGEPFLHWLVTWLKRQGLENFAFSLGYRGEQIEEWLKSAPVMMGARWHTFQEQEPLGTGGGALACLDLCAEDIVIVNGDSLFLTSLRPALDVFADPNFDGALLGAHMDDAERYGTLAVDKSDLLTRLWEKRPGSGLVNAGIYMLRKKTLEPFPARKNLSMEYYIIPRLIAEGKRLRIIRAGADTPFIDIGTPESIARAGNFIREHILEA